MQTKRENSEQELREIQQSLAKLWQKAEPVFLNVYGAQESILRNEFRQSM
jgi:hypothetical protein